MPGPALVGERVISFTAEKKETGGGGWSRAAIELTRVAFVETYVRGALVEPWRRW